MCQQQRHCNVVAFLQYILSAAKFGDEHEFLPACGRRKPILYVIDHHCVVDHYCVHVVMYPLFFQCIVSYACRSEMQGVQGIRGLCDQARLLLAIRHMGTFPEEIV